MRLSWYVFAERLRHRQLLFIGGLFNDQRACREDHSGVTGPLAFVECEAKCYGEALFF